MLPCPPSCMYSTTEVNNYCDSMYQLQPETLVNRRNVTKDDMGMYLSDCNQLLLNQDTIIDDLKTAQ